MFFKHFTRKNQLPGLSISGTLVENGLIAVENKLIKSFFVELNLLRDKRLINYLFNPHKSLLGNHFVSIK